MTEQTGTFRTRITDIRKGSVTLTPSDTVTHAQKKRAGGNDCAEIEISV